MSATPTTESTAADGTSSDSNCTSFQAQSMTDAELRKVFNQFDTNGDGKISAAELSQVANRLYCFDSWNIMDSYVSMWSSSVTFEWTGSVCHGLHHITGWHPAGDGGDRHRPRRLHKPGGVRRALPIQLLCRVRPPWRIRPLRSGQERTHLRLGAASGAQPLKHGLLSRGLLENDQIGGLWRRRQCQLRGIQEDDDDRLYCQPLFGVSSDLQLLPNSLGSIGLRFS